MSRSVLMHCIALLLTCSAAWCQSAHEDAEMVRDTLAERCFKCHSEQRQESGLRLDTALGLGSVVRPRHLDESELWRRVNLPRSHPDAMPPMGRRLRTSKVSTIERWINAGAPLAFMEAADRERALAHERARLQLEQIAAVSGARIAPHSPAANAPLLIDYSLAKQTPTAKHLATLAPIADRIFELSLARQELTSEAFAGIVQLDSLERLHLEGSSIGDEDLGVLLGKTPGLRYLNLHSTKIGRAGLEALDELESLERLVLFNCPSLTQKDIDALQKRYTGVEVTGNLRLTPAFSRGGPRRILAADASKQRIALLRETAFGKYDVLWEHKIRQIHDLHVLPGGTILFQESWTRLLEVDPRTKTTVWSYDAAKQNRKDPNQRVEIHAFQRLPGGVTMVAESGPARIIEVDHAGKLLRSVPLKVESPDAHSDTRLVRKTQKGTYLVAHEKDGCVREYDDKGRIVWSYAVPLFDKPRKGGHGFNSFGNQVFAVHRLANGNTLIATGNGHGVLEVTPKKQVVWQLKQDDLKDIRLAWVTTLQVLENGNIVIGNCHAGPKQPQIVEITRKKEVVWTFKDFRRFGNALSNSYILEDPQNK